MKESENIERTEWLARTRQRLLDLREACQRDVVHRAAAGRVVALDQTLQGRLSRIDALQQQAQAQAAQRRAEDQLQRIAAALSRIDQNRYGLCGGCQDPIAPARLQVDPCAVLCRDCAQAREVGRGGSVGRDR